MFLEVSLNKQSRETGNEGSTETKIIYFQVYIEFLTMRFVMWCSTFSADK